MYQDRATAAAQRNKAHPNARPRGRHPADPDAIACRMTNAACTPPGIVAERILAGDSAALTREDLIAYLHEDRVDVWDLMAAADRLRRAQFGNKVHLCSIVNAKQGGCPEDCGFCSQSKHFSTHVKPERFISNEQASLASEKAESQGASALGLVAAVRGLDVGTKAMDITVKQIEAVREAGHTEAHASMGLMTREGLATLKKAGLTEYNHNLESSRRYFSRLVTTHTYDDRIDTIKAAQAEGLRTCVGGIIGMGETLADRADLALQLQELDVDEVPINFLVSIEGTMLEGAEPLNPMQMLRVIAAFRMALTRQNIFIAAGRMQLGKLAPLMFSAGASGMMIGDFLTTPNHSVQDDHDMLDALGLEPLHCNGKRPEISQAPKSAKSRASLPILQPRPAAPAPSLTNIAVQLAPQQQ